MRKISNRVMLLYVKGKLMNTKDIKKKVEELVVGFNPDFFIYELLQCYGVNNATISRLKGKTTSSYNKAKVDGEVLWKKKVYYKSVGVETDLLSCVGEMKKDTAALKQDVRIVLVTDFEAIAAIDMKTGESLDCTIVELTRFYDFFEIWAGREKRNFENEKIADIKAAEKMAKLFDVIKD